MAGLSCTGSTGAGVEEMGTWSLEQHTEPRTAGSAQHRALSEALAAWQSKIRWQLTAK